MQVVYVAVAGAIGALCRWQLGSLFPTKGFPWATLGINLSGTFLLTLVLTGPLTARLNETSLVATTIGLLGSYTTFSTFGHETFTLLRTDRVTLAVAYAVVSLIGGVMFAALGYTVGKQLT